MNITCSRSELREALRLVGGVADPRNIKPILKDVRLNASEQGLELSATDLEVGLKYLVRDVKVEASGGIVVPVDPISGIVNESPADRLALEVKGNKLVITAKGGCFNVVGVSEEDFPEIPDFPEGAALEIEGAIIREMIDKTSFAVATEKQRYALNGVLFVVKEGSKQLEMVATDGRRLAVIRRKANVASNQSASAIIPVKALQQVQKMVGEEEIVKVSMQERQIFVRAENGVLVAQLVEGRFPPYDEIIPDDCSRKLEVSADEFGHCIRQAAVLAAQSSRAVLLRLDKGGSVVESADPEAGDAHVELSGAYEGAALEIHFNPDYLLDGVKAIGDETLRLEMKDASRAALMRSGADYLYLIMPITQE